MLNFPDGALEAYSQGANFVSYLDPESLASGWYVPVLLQDPGQVHDQTNGAAQLVYLNIAPQLPPPAATQPAGIATDVQVTEAVGGGSSPGGASRPLCVACGQSFTRLQELKRHLSQAHMPNRKCPFKFCTYEWKRPSKIKDHLNEVHSSELNPLVFQEIRKLRGKRVVEFVDAYEFDPYQSEYCGCCLERIDVVSSEGAFEQIEEETTE